MSQLAGAKLGLPQTKFDWESFDRLPAYMKEVCWEFNVHWGRNGSPPSHRAVAEAREQLEAKRREACAATYGREHPNAQVAFSDDDFLL